MKNSVILYLLVAMAITLTGCDAIMDIFEAGFWVGIILVVLVIGIIIWLIRKIF